MKKILKVMLCLLLLVSVGILPIFSASASSKVYILKVTHNWARLRIYAHGPDTDDNLRQKLHTGEKVLYKGEKDGAFYKVMSTKGKIGYVYKGFVKTYGVISGSSVWRVNSKATIYNSAKQNVGSLSKGTYVVFQTAQGGVAKVKTLSGRTVFLNANKITKVF